MVSIHGPLGYGPSTLPLRHSATVYLCVLFWIYIMLPHGQDNLTSMKNNFGTSTKAGSGSPSMNSDFSLIVPYSAASWWQPSSCSLAALQTPLSSDSTLRAEHRNKTTTCRRQKFFILCAAGQLKRHRPEFRRH